MTAHILSAARLRDLLHYDSKTGAFIWRIRASSRAMPGQTAGCFCEALGYILIGVSGRMYYAHRLAWLYVHGAWPTNDIDHINGNRADNRIDNLRDVPRAVNAQNLHKAPKHSSCGLLGAHRSGARWSSSITLHGVTRRLGYFDSPEQAHAAYMDAKQQHARKTALQ